MAGYWKTNTMRRNCSSCRDHNSYDAVESEEKCQSDIKTTDIRQPPLLFIRSPIKDIEETKKRAMHLLPIIDDEAAANNS
uniref:Uncharacterized protein n=1 Tax=Pristionchus pacificus TaxID=54126 RepID=A0A2A6BDK1_PRIPA|eukprot:PDM63949.1 hypothetical protein PRIPAC_49450 [Pristionchus pacificus]